MKGRSLMSGAAPRWLGFLLLPWLHLNGPLAQESGVSSNTEFLIRQWQSEEGLPQNSVTSIAQDSEGYLWMGTFGGLVRFDGHRFVVFGPSSQPVLQSSRIVQVARDGSGRIWIISEFQDAAVYEDGEFREALAGPDGGDLKIARVLVDEQGKVLIEDNQRSLFSYDGERLEEVFGVGGADLGRMVSAAVNEAGVWVAMKNLFCLAREGETIEIEKQSAEELRVEVVAPARASGAVWTAGRHSGLRRYADGNWNLGVEFPEEDTVPTCLHEEEGGRVWVGTLANGLLIWDGAGWSRLSTTEGLSHDSIRCIFEDEEGNYWVGTDGGGVNRLRRRFLDVIDSTWGLPTEVILALASDERDRLWIGFNGHGGGVLESDVFKPLKGEPWMDARSSIWTFGSMDDEAIWTGDGYGGLIGFSPDGRASRMTNSMAPRRLYERSMHRTANGTLYTGDTQGLFELKEGVFRDLSQTGGLEGDDVRAIVSDSKGRLYLGTNGRGVARRDEEGFTFFDRRHGLKDDRIWSLAMDSEDNLWVGTFGAGLSLFRDGAFYDAAGVGGLPARVVTSIVEDDHGYLWVGSMQGIFRVARRDLVGLAEGTLSSIAYRRFDRADGLKTVEVNGGYQPAACKLSDGRVCFATIKGIVRIDPTDIENNPRPARVMVEEALVDDRTIRVRPGQKLVLLPGVRRMEIRYTGISLSGPEKVRFRYQLEGWDGEWVETGNRREAYFSGMPAGEYVFRVQACNSDGVWNETGAELPFYLRPHFWRTGWFLTAVAVVGLGGGALWVRHAFVRRVRRRMAALEQQNEFERERTRIAQDIHDDLGARLTQIGLLSELAKRSEAQEDARRHLDRISSETRDMARVMDEIVWAVDPTKDRLENLADYVAAFTQDFLQASGVQCRLDIPAILPVAPLAAEARHSLIMILKEALNNVVKHAMARGIWVRLRLEDRMIVLEIEDDGSGFEAAPGGAPLDGNGLANMASRAKKAGGAVQIISQPGSGTVVRVSAPLSVFSVGRKSSELRHLGY